MFGFLLSGLFAVSVVVTLATEAIKKIFDELEVSYASNIVAGGTSLVISTAYSIGYAVLASITVDAKFIICIICLIFMSWLCAMLGYDKVVQAIKQIKED